MTRELAEETMTKKRVLVVGLGNMGMSPRARLYADPGIRSRRRLHARASPGKTLPDALAGAKRYSNYEQALAELKPDVVSINTLPDTHADYAIKAMEAGAHVFVEKPLAETVESAERVVDTARRTEQKARDRLHPPRTIRRG